MNALPLAIDATAALLIGAGSVFALLGSIGLVRFRDFYTRAHAPTKAVTLGVGCTLIASMLVASFGSGRASLHELLITLFLFLTAPVSAHLLMKAALKREIEERESASRG